MNVQTRTREGLSTSLGTFLKAILVTIMLLAVVHPAFATFPGSNGRIAYSVTSGLSSTGNALESIFLTDLGNLTLAPAGVFENHPAWSPDGSQLAFIRHDTSTSRFTIEIIRRDGTGERTLIGTEVFGAHDRGNFLLPAWSADGHSIAFIRNDLGCTPPYSCGKNRLYRINTDGTGLTEVVGPETGLDITPDNPQWSSRGDLGFTCDVVSGFAGQNKRGICVIGPGTFSELRIEPPNNFLFGEGVANVWNMSWSPDGQTIVFAALFVTSHIVNFSYVVHSEVFRVNKDGTGLVQITQTPEICSGQPNAHYFSAAPSPDGNSIVAIGRVGCRYNNETFGFGLDGLWTVDSNGDQPTLLFATHTSSFIWDSHVDWQPLPQSLTFNILDGHDNPLKGLKVELRRTDETLIDDKPINTVGGTYVFEDGVAPGDYILRATLIDRCVSPCVPAFDIRYAGNVPDEPVWLEWRFTVNSLPTPPFTLNFDSADPLQVHYSVPSYYASLLNDMANITFRVRQYVDWVKTRLTSDTGPTAHFYTFAITDPDDGKPVAPSDGYYSPLTSKIVFGVLESAYQNRDGKFEAGFNGDAPENGEWHEFTHHLYQTWIHDDACPGDLDHGGYDNLDTCNSMDEGFAEFLPTLAAQDILGPLFHPLPGSAVAQLSNSFYSDLWDLQWPTKAWGHLWGTQTSEEFAIAALFWDLVARNGNTEIGAVIGANGLPRVVTYTNTVQSTPISQLWSQLTSTHPKTVVDLRSSFGNPPLTIDLDGDGVPDVAPIDIPFLMHGFYPVDTDPIILSHTINFYDVGYAQRMNGAAPRNGAVGGTAHRVYNAAGMVTKSLIPRSKIVPGPHSNIGLTVLDAFGRPLSGAAVNLTISYPGGQTRLLRQLGSGSGALVHLELPPYFDYLLPADAPLPPCDPAHDVQVNVTLSVEKDGLASNETPSFNNCAYLQAVAAATGPAALSFTVTVPVTGGGDTIPPTTTAALSPQPNAVGWSSSNVTVTLNSTDNPGGSGVKQITYSASGAQSLASTTVNVSSVPIVISTEGTTTVSFFATDNAGNVEIANTLTVRLDKTPPSTSCGAADSLWHAADVSIQCTASDAGSGLANSSDASFVLSTAVPVGTETAGAPTGTRSVCDVSGNCANAGPIGGNMIDKKPPSISITTPANTNYLLGQGIGANYACADGGSGVAACTGTVAQGSGIDTSSVGSKTFTVNATDKVGNLSSPQAVTYSVSYNLCLLYDPTRSVNGGSTLPLKLQLCDANNADVSQSAVVLHGLSLVQAATNASEVLQASGNANPNNDFRFDSSLGPTGGYIFNLSTKGLTTGSYLLSFSAGADPTAHTLMFQVR
jgi:hypothetical protein